MVAGPINQIDKYLAPQPTLSFMEALSERMAMEWVDAVDQRMRVVAFLNMGYRDEVLLGSDFAALEIRALAARSAGALRAPIPTSRGGWYHA